MSRLRILRPEATVNLCTNPSVEKDLTGWASSGLTTFDRVTDWSARGAYSAHGIADGASDQLQGPSFNVTNGVTYAITAWAYVVSGSWRALVSGTAQTLVTGLNRIEIIYTAGVTTTRRLALECLTAPGEAYLDAVQYEQKGYSTSYCDGEEDGCKWSSAEHGSTSSRPITSRAGGRPIDLKDDAGIALWYADIAGVGMPPLSHVAQELALADGSDLQRIRANPAILTFTATQRGAGLQGLHALRRALVDLVKPDATPATEPLKLLYSGSGTEYEIGAHYLGGLEANIAPPSVKEKLAAQFVAYDPRWKAPLDVGETLATSSSITSADYLIARIDGVWQRLGSAGANGVVRTIKIAPNGRIYVAGEFTSIGGVAANRIAYWDPADSAWHAMGTGISGPVYAIDLAADGVTLYAGGLFVTAGGVTVNNVAKWTGSAWAALGATPGTNNYVLALKVTPSGGLYVTGFFTSAGGVGVNGFAVWNPVTSLWAAGVAVDLIAGASTGGYGLEIAPNDDIYVAGSFTVSGGGSVEDVAFFDASASAWSTLGGSVGAFGPSTLFPTDVLLGPDGMLYIAGQFTSPASFITKWNGQQFLPLGSGLSNLVNALAFDETGELYVGGTFQTAGGLKLTDRIARWNGSSWLPLPINLGGSSEILAIASRGSTLVLGGAFTGTAVAAGRTTVTNPGSSSSYPIVKITGPGTLRSLTNITTGHEIIFDKLILVSGEVLRIDLRPGRKRFTSSSRGDVSYAIVGGSDVATWLLAPGANDVALLCEDIVTSPTAVLYFRPRHWSAE